MISLSVRSEDGSVGFVTLFISSRIGSDAGGSDVPFKEEDTNPTPWKVVQYSDEPRLPWQRQHPKLRESLGN